MIEKAFDNSREIIKPDDTITDIDKEIAANYKIDTFIVVFSHKLIELLLSNNKIEAVDERLTIGSAAYKSPIFVLKDTNIGMVLSGIGSPMAVAIIEELNVLFHSKNYIVFGSSGSLIEIEEGKVVIPNYAYRDEGTSYHYVEASDYIEIKNSQKLSSIFDELKIDYVVGKTWTTDAFYRETENKKNLRVSEGCICVEMECSALQAVCDYRGLELYQFVYTADSLDGKWQRRILGNMEKDARLLYFEVAKMIAQKL